MAALHTDNFAPVSSEYWSDNWAKNYESVTQWADAISVFSTINFVKDVHLRLQFSQTH